MNKYIVFLFLLIIAAVFIVQPLLQAKEEVKVVKGILVVPVIDISNKENSRNYTSFMIFHLNDENGKITYRGRMAKNLLLPLLKKSETGNQNSLFKIKMRVRALGSQINEVEEIISYENGWIRTPK